MIASVVALHILTVALQAGVDAPRKAFSTCLKEASAKALTGNVAVDQYKAFVGTQCGSQAAALKAGLVSFDTKHGVKRAQATSDADAQIDEYLLMAHENYEAKKARPH